MNGYSFASPSTGVRLLLCLIYTAFPVAGIPNHLKAQGPRDLSRRHVEGLSPELGPAFCAKTRSYVFASLISPAEEPLAIYEIQSDGFQSPYAGETRETYGVVTAVGHQGFYLQDPKGDGDPRTSDGIYVYTGANGDAPKVGDGLRLSGRIEEFVAGGKETHNLSVTQLKSPKVHETIPNQPLPKAVVIGRKGRKPPGQWMFRPVKQQVDLNSTQSNGIRLDPQNYGIDFYESLEGMRVRIENPVCISGMRSYGTFSSEIYVLADRGLDVVPTGALVDRGVLKLQPDAMNRGDQNPERIQVQFDASPGGQGTLFNEPLIALQVGHRFTSITGVVGYSFGNYEVNATQAIGFEATELKQEVTSLLATDNRLTLASYNVLNLSGDSSDDGQRQQLARQIVDHLKSPDIIALQEIQDDSGEKNDGVVTADQTLKRLTQAIEAAGGPRYEAFNVAPKDGNDGGVPGGNIRNAFLFQPDRVELVDYMALSSKVLKSKGCSDPTAFEGSRTPLQATFKFLGHELTVVNNHLSSRYGSSPVSGALQPFDQGGSRGRDRQTRCLNDWINRRLDQNPENPLVVLGDMNTFEFTKELGAQLTQRKSTISGSATSQPALVNLLGKASEGDRYTYIFEGNAQALDHCFVSPELHERAEYDIVHVNTEFFRGVELSPDGPVASDHEPILARFQFKVRR